MNRDRGRTFKARRRDFLVGFEFEFRSRILDKKYGGSDRLTGRTVRTAAGALGEDGGCYELRTKPVRGDGAMKLLFDSLRFLRDCRAVTRYNDGLHVNVSCVDKKRHFRLNPVSLWVHAEPRRWAMIFGRSRHIHCRLPSKTTPLDIVKFLSFVPSHSSDAAINFSNFNPRTSPIRSRIEFRYPGGKNYHRRAAVVGRCLESILEAAGRSFM